MRTPSLASVVALLVLLGSNGCGGGPARAGDDDGDDDADQPDPGPEDAPLTVRIVATTRPFAHDDGLSGQTALHASGGVRSLQLLRDADDPSPVTIFDLGAAVFKTGYDDGDETVVARVEIPAGLRGRFARARLVQGYSRYAVEALLHDGVASEPGVVGGVLVMSDGTSLDGGLRDAGEYDFRFEGPSTTFSWVGADWPVPLYSTTAGATAVVEDGEWAVYFPIDLEVAAAVAPGSEMLITVNMDRSFRWTDLFLLGYEHDEFDVTRSSYEPVLRFGGNRFELTLIEPGT